MDIQNSIFNPYAQSRGMYSNGPIPVQIPPAQTSAKNSTATGPQEGQAERPAEQEQTVQNNQESGSGQTQLTEEELRVVEELKQIDAEVRRHEMAHLSAGGALITSAANFSYQRGPDGKNYAVGGEVGIDTSPVPGDPQATLQKMRQIRSAALAPADPSSQDMKVAASAASEAAKAMSEITMLQAKEQAEQRENQAFGNTQQEAADAYTRVNGLPEDDTSTFQIAV